jgi:hypothetical protein
LGPVDTVPTKVRHDVSGNSALSAVLRCASPVTLPLVENVAPVPRVPAKANSNLDIGLLAPINAVGARRILPHNGDATRYTRRYQLRTPAAQHARRGEAARLVQSGLDPFQLSTALGPPQTCAVDCFRVADRKVGVEGAQTRECRGQQARQSGGTRP